MGDQIRAVGRAVFLEPPPESMTLRALPVEWHDLIVAILPLGDLHDTIARIRREVLDEVEREIAKEPGVDAQALLAVGRVVARLRGTREGK